MKVLKFGGTSVADSQSLSHVIEIIKKSKDEQQIVVVSALGGITNMLVEMAENASVGKAEFQDTIQVVEQRHLAPILHFIPVTNQSEVISFLKSQLNSLEELLESIYTLRELTPKSLAKVSSFGEILSSKIIFYILKSFNLDVVLKDARELLFTHEINEREVVNHKSSANACIEFISDNSAKIILVPGFIASDEKGKITTLGRGGSDYTASLLANYLNVALLEIWTDVSGMFTAHPNLVSQALPIARLSYQEAMELSHFGAKVIYPPTLQPLIEKEIPILIKNTFDADAQGTKIDNNGSSKGGNGTVVKGVSHIEKVALINLEGSGMIGIPGFSKRLFECLSLKQINIIMITQASSEHSICIGVRMEDAAEAKKAIDSQFEFEISRSRVEPAKVELNMTNIAVVGDDMKKHQGISGKLFSSLGANNINIKAIAQGASERNISIIIDERNTQKALNTIHESFFETQTKELNLFITGVGNVGSKLLEQISQQEDYLLENLRLKIRVISLSNSRKMLLSDTPIDLDSWKEKLDKSTVTADRESFFDHIKKLNLRNSIFVDNTANEEIASEYNRFLENNIGVVTCNKIACASTLSNYKELKKTARKFGTPFLFETNVGAGLPVIDTLNNLIASGDEIHKIQAILSGSLNFVFNNFTSESSFMEVVKSAQEEGYTEPDPKIDLSGVDVARKILILARESGFELDLENIKNQSFLPKEVLDTSTNDAFFEALKKHETHFQSILAKANDKNCRLKYVAQLEGGKASVGLQEIEPTHDFYNLEGSDNIILFYTNRYKNQPLIVKGAGAGAEVTAGGIFGDIIRIGKA
ncbi:bifunctional aspartate kinase/homoserine dehydrogenase I [Flavobacteriaceae bacterium]|nr:bifunctional aspartate kinase/homoserine dehydrogenase I [Flavobacteriaceae bacterium]